MWEFTYISVNVYIGWMLLVAGKKVINIVIVDYVAVSLLNVARFVCTKRI